LAQYPRIGKSNHRFSKPWNISPVGFPRLGNNPAKFSKPWKSAGSGSQTGRVDIFCGTSAPDALLFRRQVMRGWMFSWDYKPCC
jgi:hypothetical protein